MENEEENKFLAAEDFENVKLTDKVDTAAVEKANRSTEVNKHRFMNEIKELQWSPIKLSVKVLH